MSSDLNGIQKIHKETLCEAVLPQIEAMILSGKIAPGDRVNESHLSKMLGISRGPIREACQQLHSRGLLEIKTNRGMFVRNVRLDDVEDLFDIRAVLDALAGTKAAERIRTEDVAELRNCIARMAEHLKANDAEAYYRANISFHISIIHISGNKHLISIYEGICHQTSLFHRALLSLSDRLSDSLDWHRRIVEALARRDGKTAARLLSDHILNGKQALLDSMNVQRFPVPPQ